MKFIPDPASVNSPPYKMDTKPSFMLFIFLLLLGCYSNLGTAREESFVIYVQEITGGENATIVTVAGMNGKSSNRSDFGTVNVEDHGVTEGPDPTSKILGRFQGMEATTDFSGTSFHMIASVIFEDGSTLQIHGILNTLQTHRELSIVGGTGRFRYAHGYVVVEVVAVSGLSLTFKFNATVQI